MPFLEHLEELRSRLIKALLGLVGGVGIGLFLVDRLQLVTVLAAPILPLLPPGMKLVVQSPTEPIMITLKLGFIAGLVLASPVILWQVWAFLAPALYAKEKRAIVPALFAGLVLFATGAVLSFIFLVPQALRVLLSFQSGAFTTLITFDAYFDFILQVVLAMGLSAELPLVMILLAALGVVTPQLLGRVRRFAVVGAFIAGAILSPGTDVFSMLLMTAPILVLYELGVLGAWLIHRRRRLKAAATTTLVAVLMAMGSSREAEAQQPPRPPVQQPPRPFQPPARSPGDTGRGQRSDSAAAKRMGLPTAPKQQFPAADSVINELLDLEGYEPTRYRSDSAVVSATNRQVQLHGNAMTDRSGATLEAGSIMYQEGDCRFEAQHDPHLFQNGKVVVGDGVHYNTCVNRGLVTEGLTSFPQQGANWFIRGNLAVDSSSTRLYATAKEITSCDLPLSHYHFSAKELKWVSKSTMVARPAVLYIRDVPVAWIPFLFQDTKQGRHSGILIPEFGFNDIVRPARNYNRTIKNIGYYWAPNDYFDILGRFDWFSNRYTEYGFEARYRWIDRFVTGSIAYTRQNQLDGSQGTNSHIIWRHQQQFSVTTRLNVDLDYTTNSSLIQRNSIDPLLVTQQIRSSANLSKQFSWGSIQIGGNRNQNVNDNSGTQTFPTLTISPKPIDIGQSITWSPNFSLTNNTSFKQKVAPIIVPRLDGTFDTLPQVANYRNTQINFDTPLRIGSFNLTNTVRFADTDSTGRAQETVRIPDLSTPDPNDSITVTRIRNGGFGSEFDWNTSFNLPILFRTSWKLQPSVGVTNIVSGSPLAIRNARTGGAFVFQGKRLQLGLGITPTFFGMLPGFGPIAKIRHTINPALNFSYSPAADVPEDFAHALYGPGQQPILRSDPAKTATLTLNQNFEAKGHPKPGDTTGTSARKYRLLSINTSGVSYDFEQASKPGRNGWTTQILTNSFQSDLVPGFSLSIGHDLWNGPVGLDSSKFSPFLSSVTTSFSLTGRTFHALGALFGLVPKDKDDQNNNPQQPPGGAPPDPFNGFPRGSAFTSPTAQTFQRGSRSFNASINYTLSRIRPPKDPRLPATPNQSNLGLNMSFSPTQFWSLNWNTQYNGTAKRFESQQLNLTRDLHDWRATFNFTKSPNGNFAFSFLITLIDLPEIKFDYRQSTIQP